MPKTSSKEKKNSQKIEEPTYKAIGMRKVEGHDKWTFYELTIQGDTIVDREEYPAIRRPYAFDELKTKAVKLFWQGQDE